ncbi:DUF3039 domain-containing protein [Brachybacterium alimentarium]|uniref:DUF3039 domain-containing protein n=1 Tax=Brachybacterium alimentarium TaxID=47845 RepID=UPI003FD6BE79
MSNVRPTLRVVKILKKGSKLPSEVASVYESASRIDDPRAKFDKLREIDLDNLDVAVLGVARSQFAAETLDTHKSMSREADRPVYEVRDRESPAWRGAVIRLAGDEDAWMVHADRHDEFNDRGFLVIRAMKKKGTLGPSSMDRKLRDDRRGAQQEGLAQIELLQALLAAMRKSAESEAETVVALPSIAALATSQLRVHVRAVFDDWDPGDAHEYVEDLSVTMRMPAADSAAARDWLLKTCVPFIQPDTSMQDPLYNREGLSVVLVVTRGRLMQLLATDDSDLPTAAHTPPPPQQLHYTGKVGLTKAYVEGNAVRAVCGQWWIPIGDESTHVDLPVCPECAAEKPFADGALSLLQRGTD